MIGIRSVAADYDLQEVGVLEAGWCYDWAEIHIWVKNGRLYWYSDSGCSCTSFGDEVVSLADLETGGRQACCWAIDAFVREYRGDEGITSKSGADLKAAVFDSLNASKTRN